MIVEDRLIAELKPYEKNAKVHPQKQVDLLAQNIEKFGFTTPVLIDEHNSVIAGHGRLLAMTQLGKDSVPCVRIEGLSEDEVRALRLADNRIAELGGWDMSLALEELKGLSDENFILTGFDRDLIIEADEKDNTVPVAPKEAKSNLGDIYVLGEHRVICGDSTNLDTIATLMAQFKADMMVTDPPYNVAYNDDSAENLKARRRRQDTLTVMNDKMEDADFRVFLKDAFSAADAFMKPGGVFYIWHADAEGYNFRGACHDIGWKVRQCLIWNKNTMVMGRQDYHWKHEPCLYGWKDGASHLWNTDRKQVTVLDFERPSRSESHPTMKPVELIAYQITNNSKGEDIVFDPFLGSGTTLIAAEKNRRRCFGAELDPKYVDVIVQRWVDYTGIEKVYRNGEEIEWKKSEEAE